MADCSSGVCLLTPKDCVFQPDDRTLAHDPNHMLLSLIAFILPVLCAARVLEQVLHVFVLVLDRGQADLPTYFDLP